VALLLGRITEYCGTLERSLPNRPCCSTKVHIAYGCNDV
jgi:hypothetical protein